MNEGIKAIFYFCHIYLHSQTLTKTLFSSSQTRVFALKLFTATKRRIGAAKQQTGAQRTL